MRWPQNTSRTPLFREIFLARMERTLACSAFLAGEALTLADVALVAYTRMAHEGGFDLAGYGAIRAWIGRVEDGLGIGPYAGPA